MVASASQAHSWLQENSCDLVVGLALETLQTPSQDALFLESILDHLPAMVFVKEAETLRFLRFNVAGEKLVGVPRDELLGKTDFDFFPEEEASFFQSKDRQVLESKRLLDIPEETLQTRSGPRILHTQKIPLCDDQGNARYLLGISHDITEQKQAQAELSARLQAAQERERSRIARELHDELGQLLTALQLDLTWLEERLPDKLAPRAEAMQELLEQTVQTVRRLATRLRPQIIDDLGLSAGLDWLGRELCGRKGIEYRVEAHRAVAALTEESVTALFRICQEALLNIVRHSDASAVEVKVEITQERVRLLVEDNGSGFVEEGSTSGLGIAGMRERANLLGGKLTIESRPGEGVRIEVVAPAARCLAARVD